MKKIKKIILVIIVLVLVFLYAHVDNTTDLYHTSTETTQYVATNVVYDGTVEQTFVSDEDVLDGVSLKSGIVGDCSGVVLHYSLVDQSGEIVAEGSVEANKIKDKKFYKYKFPQIKNCKGKEYTFKIEQTGATENQGIIFYVDPTVEDTVIAGNENIEGILVAKLISHRFDVKTYVIVLVLISYLVCFTKLLYKLFK